MKPLIVVFDSDLTSIHLQLCILYNIYCLEKSFYRIFKKISM